MGNICRGEDANIHWWEIWDSFRLPNEYLGLSELASFACL